MWKCFASVEQDWTYSVGWFVCCCVLCFSSICYLNGEFWKISTCDRFWVVEIHFSWAPITQSKSTDIITRRLCLIDLIVFTDNYLRTRQHYIVHEYSLHFHYTNIYRITKYKRVHKGIQTLYVDKNSLISYALW